MLTTKQPFSGETKDELFTNITSQEINFEDELFKDMSPIAIDFLKKGLDKNE